MPFGGFFALSYVKVNLGLNQSMSPEFNFATFSSAIVPTCCKAKGELDVKIRESNNQSPTAPGNPFAAVVPTTPTKHKIMIVIIHRYPKVNRALLKTDLLGRRLEATSSAPFRKWNSAKNRNTVNNSDDAISPTACGKDKYKTIEKSVSKQARIRLVTRSHCSTLNNAWN